MKIFIVILLLVVPTSVWSNDFVLICDAPIGKTFVFGEQYRLTDDEAIGNDTIEFVEDGFTGVTPTVARLSTFPDHLFLRWGSTRVPGVEIDREQFRQLPIVQQDDRQVQAIDTNCGGARCVTSLISVFPNAGVMTLSRTIAYAVHPRDNAAMGSFFAAACSPIE